MVRVENIFDSRMLLKDFWGHLSSLRRGFIINSLQFIVNRLLVTIYSLQFIVNSLQIIVNWGVIC